MIAATLAEETQRLTSGESMPPEMVFLGALLATVASGLMAWELRKVSKGFALLSKILDAPQVEREWLKDTLNAQTNRMRKQD